VTGSYLLDTSVISLFAPGRPAIDGDLADWLRAREGRLFLSAVTILEIEQGVRKLFRSGGEARAKRLEKWLEATLAEFGDHVLAADTRVAHLAGQMADAATAAGAYPGLADILIAATAQANSALILTRNGKHFAQLDVAFVDPLEGLPD
jgi:hypothetical protein